MKKIFKSLRLIIGIVALFFLIIGSVNADALTPVASSETPMPGPIPTPPLTIEPIISAPMPLPTSTPIFIPSPIIPVIPTTPTPLPIPTPEPETPMPGPTPPPPYGITPTIPAPTPELIIETSISAPMPILKPTPITSIVNDPLILIPVTDKCPDEYLASEDGKKCIKLSPPTVIEAMPIVSLKPIKGECPNFYILNEDIKECIKPILPDAPFVSTIFIAPQENSKGIIFAPKEGKIIIKDNKLKEEAVISPEEEFRTIVSIESKKESPIATQTPSVSIKEVIIQSKIEFGKTIMSVGNFVVSTKEPIEVKENKIYLNEKEVKIMPDTVSNIAVEKLQALDFEIELKDVGKPVYEIAQKEDVKIFGLFKKEMIVKTQISAETGEIEKTKKPWWNFLAW